MANTLGLPHRPTFTPADLFEENGNFKGAEFEKDGTRYKFRIAKKVNGSTCYQVNEIRCSESGEEQVVQLTDPASKGTLFPTFDAALRAMGARVLVICPERLAKANASVLNQASKGNGTEAPSC